MFSLTAAALNNNRLVILLVIVIGLTGIISFQTHPSREDPKITIRTAVVTASLPGMSPQRVENLITRKIEEKVREMAEVEKITSTTSSGQTTVRVELYDRYFDLEPIWQDLRNKMEDVRPELPSGVQGPNVNDSYGEVAMATIALTGEGFTLAEMRAEARELRNKLYTVPGISKISLYGIEPERIFVEINNSRLAQLGLHANDIIAAVTQTNIIAPGGKIEAGISSYTVEPSGNFESLDDIGQVTIELPNEEGQVVYLRDLATIERAYVDPPRSPVFFNGKPAIVLSVQMVDQFDSEEFGHRIKTAISDLESGLPIGYVLDFITFQPKEIKAAVDGVMFNLYQTVSIVLVVVMLFLGWRTGLIVGAMVPLTMLLTLLVMRYVGIELESMSLAALIISLGLLVDNGIVMSEEIGQRIASGQPRFQAVVDTGTSLALPLLSSSLTTIIAFLPLMLAENEAGEYTRSLSLVIAIALLGSWFIAMTVTPLLCHEALPKPKPNNKEEYDGALYDYYYKFLDLILNYRFTFLLIIMLCLGVSLWAMRFVPQSFFPASERSQFQVYIDLPVGSNTYGSIAAAKQMTTWLNDKATNPEIESHIAYVASGGPRFYLGLDPIDPDANRTFLIVNTQSSEQIPEVMQRVQGYALGHMPEARVQVKPMSMGGTEAGLVEYRVVGDDPNQLMQLADEIKAGLRSIDGTVNVKDNWENRLIKIVVDIDQARARRSGTTSEAVASALESTLSGVAVTDYRDGDTLIPIYFRAEGEQRTNIDRFRTLNIAKTGDVPIPLMQIADFEAEVEFAFIQRRNLERVITVSAKHLTMPAVELDAAMQPVLAKLNLGDTHRLEKGGELQASSEAQGALFANMPLAFMAIVLILVAQFNSLRNAVIILGVIPLTLVGVTSALLIMPGANLSFIGILGLLSLAGIIINNAIVLIDRILIELGSGQSLEDAIVAAAIKRLRPIIMTTITTILGLMPLIISRDVLFYDLAVVVSGGLMVGTVLTLGVVPVLFSLFYQNRQKARRL